MECNCKRSPPKDAEKKRVEISSRLKLLTPVKPIDNLVHGLSSGNSKTGKSGKYFDSVFIWNLPPFVTCPGCSEWCCSHCYNADDRSSVYPIQIWRENWWTYLNKPDELKAKIKAQLADAHGHAAVRIHSSGDFFSNDYIIFWINIILDHPEVKFWAYTRSWAVAELQCDIHRLSELQNMSLYASWDSTMSDVQLNLPKSYVFDDTNRLFSSANLFGGLVCPEQFGKIGNCADCGQCMAKSGKDVLFVLH